MALIHLMVKPYANEVHNIFDGAVLHLIVLLSVLPIVQFIDSYNEVFVLMVVYLLIILPLASFIIIKLWINRNKIQNTFIYWIEKFSQAYNRMYIDAVDNLINDEMNEVSIDDVRRNATIVDV